MEWNFLRGTTFRILERMAHIFGKRAQVESFAHIEINKIENRRACPTVKMCPIPTFCITVLNFTTFLQQRVMLSSVRLWVCSECVFLPSSLPLSPHLHLHEIPSPCKHTYHGIEQLYKKSRGRVCLTGMNSWAWAHCLGIFDGSLFSATSYIQQYREGNKRIRSRENNR